MKMGSVPIKLHKFLEMGQDFSIEFSSAEHFRSIPPPYGGVDLFSYYLLWYVCVLVCYKKDCVTFDPNDATFTQKIDDSTGWVINFNRPKMV